MLPLILLSPRLLWLLDLPENEKGYRDCRDITATHLLHHNHLVVIECTKSGYARDKVLRFRDQRQRVARRMSGAHRKFVVRKPGPTPFRCPVRNSSQCAHVLSLDKFKSLNVFYNVECCPCGVYSTPVCLLEQRRGKFFVTDFRSLYHSEFSLAPRGGTKPYARARASARLHRTGAKEPNYRANIWIF